MEFRDYVRILRKNWALVLVLVLVGVGAAAAYSIIQTPKYSATSKVFVSTQGGDTASDLAQGNTFTQQRVKTYTEVVQTPIVLLPVIAKLELNITAGELGKMVEASAPLNTNVIDVTVTHPDPVTAADVANGIAQSLTNVVRDIESVDVAAPSDPADPNAGGTVEKSPVKLTLIQDASVPMAPVSPNVPLNIALGVLVGLALGVSIAVLRETLDTRIRSERDVELVTDIPVVGGITFDAKAPQRPLIVQDDPRSPRAESFRTLRTNLQFLNVGDKARSFVITSSIQSEGKSTTAANLAIALADSGARVLLVDADLRRPRVDEYMGLEGAVGLTDLLIGRAEAVDIIQPWGRAELYVLPAGKIPPNPSELLGSARMHELAELFAREFDYVLYDAPPLLPVTDAALLSKNAGGAIIVAAVGRTQKNQLKGAISTLQNVDAPIAGLVLTMLPTKGPDAYGYGRYGYGYGYGYGDEPAAESARDRRKQEKARERERTRALRSSRRDKNAVHPSPTAARAASRDPRVEPVETRNPPRVEPAETRTAPAAPVETTPRSALPDQDPSWESLFTPTDEPRR